MAAQRVLSGKPARAQAGRARRPGAGPGWPTAVVANSACSGLRDGHARPDACIRSRSMYRARLCQSAVVALCELAVSACSASSDAPASDAPAADDSSVSDAKPDRSDTDASACPPPLVLRYEVAGCGTAAHAVCGSDVQHACATTVCGCDGATTTKCDFARQPWSHVGSCDGSDSGNPDAAPSDADICTPPSTLVYVLPGCGANAHPVCGGPAEDACAIPTCACDGTLINRCDFATVPFSHTAPGDGGSCGVVSDQ